MPQTIRYISYAYSATGDHLQSEAQHRITEAWAGTQEGTWVCVERYSDGPSRPALGNAFIAMVEQQIDVFAVTSIDRIGRRLSEVAERIRMAQYQGWAFVATWDSQGPALNMTTPMGRLMVQMLLTFVEYEASFAKAHRQELVSGTVDERELH